MDWEWGGVKCDLGGKQCSESRHFRGTPSRVVDPRTTSMTPHCPGRCLPISSVHNYFDNFFSVFCTRTWPWQPTSQFLYPHGFCTITLPDLLRYLWSHWHMISQISRDLRFAKSQEICSNIMPPGIKNIRRLSDRLVTVSWYTVDNHYLVPPSNVSEHEPLFRGNLVEQTALRRVKGKRKLGHGSSITQGHDEQVPC